MARALWNICWKRSLYEICFLLWITNHYQSQQRYLYTQTKWALSHPWQQKYLIKSNQVFILLNHQTSRQPSSSLGPLSSINWLRIICTTKISTHIYIQSCYETINKIYSKKNAALKIHIALWKLFINFQKIIKKFSFFFIHIIILYHHEHWYQLKRFHSSICHRKRNICQSTTCSLKKR